ncbi:MAG: hypothetical protein RL706_612 [Pseudomonadota bacterium]|jgi:protein CpxP
MTISRRIALTAALLMGSAIHATSFAQAPDAPAQGMHQKMGASHMESHREARHQKRLESLKASLQIQASQENAWNAFAGTMTKPDHKMGSHKAANFEKLTTPERIDKMMSMKSERDAVMTKRMEATKTFYAALTPAQQKEFDSHAQKFMKHGAMGQHGKMHP